MKFSKVLKIDRWDFKTNIKAVAIQNDSWCDYSNWFVESVLNLIHINQKDIVKTEENESGY